MDSDKQDQKIDKFDSGDYLPSPAEKRMKPYDRTEYDRTLIELANLLNIAPHPNSLVTLQAAKLVLEKHLSSSSILSHKQHEGRNDIIEGQQQQQQQQQSKDSCSAAQNETRIQQSKFTLADISLPKLIIKSAANNIANEALELHQQVPPQLSLSSSINESTSDCVSHETRSTALMGLTRKDELLDTFERASKALKLLYLDDQRQLQNQVNELISSIQSITANPKTDPRLLASGR